VSLKKVIRLIIALSFVVTNCFYGVFDAATAAQRTSTDPLVIVVHGRGGGNRESGWSKDAANSWGVGPVHEVTFRYPGRSEPRSYSDFANCSEEWAKSVHEQIQEIAKANPGRPIMIVAHSWGSVAAQMALSNTGVGPDTPPIDLGGRRVSEFIMLGSPLGRADDESWGNLNQLNVDVVMAKPAIVDKRVNIFDVRDKVAAYSHNMPDSENRACSGSFLTRIPGYGPLKAHTGIWTLEETIDEVRSAFKSIKEKAGEEQKRELEKQLEQQMAKEREREREKERQREREKNRQAEQRQVPPPEPEKPVPPEVSTKEIVNEIEESEEVLGPHPSADKRVTTKDIMERQVGQFRNMQNMLSMTRVMGKIYGSIPTEDGGGESVRIPTEVEIQKQEAQKQLQRQQAAATISAIGGLVAAAASAYQQYKQSQASSSSSYATPSTHTPGTCGNPQAERAAAEFMFWKDK